MDVSHDGSLVAAGFATSDIRLWNVKDDHLRYIIILLFFIDNIILLIFDCRIFNRSGNSGGDDMDEENATNNNNNNNNSNKQEYLNLLGHSGPVYGVNFSPDNRFVLSCSEDHTCRLWSLETQSNLVVYKVIFKLI